jgi:hypothetical protein
LFSPDYAPAMLQKLLRDQCSLAGLGQGEPPLFRGLGASGADFAAFAAII